MVALYEFPFTRKGLPPRLDHRRRFWRSYLNPAASRLFAGDETAALQALREAAYSGRVWRQRTGHFGPFSDYTYPEFPVPAAATTAGGGTQRLDELMALMERFHEVCQADNCDWRLLVALSPLRGQMTNPTAYEQKLHLAIEKQIQFEDLNNLGFDLADRYGRYQDAADLLVRAVELQPDNYYCEDSLGWALFKIGRFTGRTHQGRAVHRSDGRVLVERAE